MKHEIDRETLERWAVVIRDGARVLESHSAHMAVSELQDLAEEIDALIEAEEGECCEWLHLTGRVHVRCDGLLTTLRDICPDCGRPVKIKEGSEDE
jgi:hypothetical protein